MTAAVVFGTCAMSFAGGRVSESAQTAQGDSVSAVANHENRITPAHETIMIFPLPGTSRTGLLIETDPRSSTQTRICPRRRIARNSGYTQAVTPRSDAKAKAALLSLPNKFPAVCSPSPRPASVASLDHLARLSPHVQAYHENPWPPPLPQIDRPSEWRGVCASSVQHWPVGRFTKQQGQHCDDRGRRHCRHGLRFLLR